MSFPFTTKQFFFVSLSLLIGLAFLMPQLPAQENPKQAAPRKPDTSWNFEPNPQLPNVLIIGDSISIGYTRTVRSLLKDKANVYRPMKGENAVENCAYTAHGLANIDKWLGDKKWKVITFNWGLHDLAYVNEKGVKTKIAEGKLRYPIEQYEKNLDALVKKMKASGAKLIWVATTAVPEGEPGRKIEDALKYNAAAEKVMKENGVQILDLYSVTKDFKPELWSKPGDVHYSAKGYSVLAENVADAIKKNL